MLQWVTCTFITDALSCCPAAVLTKKDWFNIFLLYTGYADIHTERTAFYSLWIFVSVDTAVFIVHQT